MNMKKLIMKIQTSKFFNGLLSWARYIGLESVCYRMFFYFLRKHPSDDMLTSKAFYQINNSRIKKNLSFLYDEESRDVYKKMILFRCKKDYRSFPKVEKEQYFVDNIVKLTNDEVYVDGGGYTGDTSLNFMAKVGGQYRKIVVFEPDKSNYNILQETLKGYKNIVSYNEGLYSETTHLFFNNNRGEGSKVDQKGEVEIPVAAIDDVEECKDATFIKMDIEGSELKALMGARKTILNNRPKLAICIYHSDEDMLDIVEYVHELNPDYKLYVRHHSRAQGETVLYAI